MYLWFDLVESSPSHIDVGVVVKQTFGFPDHLLTQRRHTLMLKLGSWILSLVLLTTIAFQQHQLIDNQRAQMKQQFHSGGIALVALFGDDGLRKLRSVTDPKYLSDRENFATGLLLQRFIAAYRIRAGRELVGENNGVGSRSTDRRPTSELLRTERRPGRRPAAR